MAANIAVKAPIIEQVYRNFVVLDIFVIRISKNIPATTIVELCNRAETGVGPSIAAGNQG